MNAILAFDYIVRPEFTIFGFDPLVFNEALPRVRGHLGAESGRCVQALFAGGRTQIASALAAAGV
jgi:hypothetical protein